jgi:spermidine synthase
LVIIVIFALPSELWLKKLVFPNQDILKTSETPYGNLVVTKSANQINIFENHELLFTTQNEIENEETVHYAMLQLTNPKNVLVISGNPKGLTNEILKYKSVSHVDYVEENRWLLKIFSYYDTIPTAPILTIHQQDIRKFLTQSQELMYDAIILATNDPSTIQANRYYTFEFFRLLKTHLTANGVISLGLPTSGDYFTAKNMQMHSVINNTLKCSFPYTLIIPGEKDYIIASKQPISSEIGALSQNRGIENTYVNQFYIDDFALAQKIKLIGKALDINSGINKDFKPLAVYLSTNRYTSKFSGKTWLITLLPLLILLLPVIRFKHETFAAYISGFSIASFEIILLLSFQIIFGYVYAASGIIISACMAGLALGTIGGGRWNIYPNKRTLIINQLLIGVSIPLFVWLISITRITWNNSILYLIFFLAVLLPSVFAGFQFCTLIKFVEKNGTISGNRLYSADLFGAAMGAASISLIFLPIIGMESFTWVIFILNLLAVIFILFKK